MNYTGPYEKLVAQALADGAVYVYVCDGDAPEIDNLVDDTDALPVDSDVVRQVPLAENSPYLGCEFSRNADLAPLYGHAEAPRSFPFDGEGDFTAEIFCKKTTSFTNGRVLAGITANGGGQGLVTPSVFRIGVNGEVAHGILTEGNPNSQLALGTGAQALVPHLYAATWKGDEKLHCGYRDGLLHATHILPNEGVVYDPNNPSGIAIGGCPTLGNKNADCVVGFYALYPVALTPEQLQEHARLLDLVP